MYPKAIRAPIKSLNIVGKINVRFNVAEGHLDWLNRALGELWLNAQRRELSST